MTNDTSPGRRSEEDARLTTCEDWARAAHGWARWEPFFAACTWPVTSRLVAGLDLHPGDRVLDLGCGIGDPGLQVASVVGPEGRVLSLDPAEGMIRVARTRAKLLDITNIEHRVAGIEGLTAEDGPFDAAVARFVIGLLPDPDRVLASIRGVLAPGGRFAMASWASTDVNRMFGIPREQFAKHIKKPAPSDDPPGPLRFAKPGKLENLLKRAGFEDVRVTLVRFYNFARSPEEYFDMVNETAVAFHLAFKTLTVDQQRSVREGFLAAVAEHETDGVIRVPAAVRVACATNRAP
ncbi:MAG: methyltransferase domain-containing protein [Phycisphaerae bacterium]